MRRTALLLALVFAAGTAAGYVIADGHHNERSVRNNNNCSSSYSEPATLILSRHQSDGSVAAYNLQVVSDRPSGEHWVVSTLSPTEGGTDVRTYTAVTVARTEPSVNP